MPPPVTATRKWFDEVFDLCIADIKDICKAAGNAGVSVGVIHRGHQRTYYLGYRDVKKQLPPNDGTLYCIASLTKAMTATALGLLVEDHIPLKTKDRQESFNWKTKISDLFPELKSAANPIIAEEANAFVISCLTIPALLVWTTYGRVSTIVSPLTNPKPYKHSTRYSVPTHFRIRLFITTSSTRLQGIS